MRRVIKGLLVLGAAALVWAPAQARADGFVVPWFGTSFSAGPNLDSAKNGATSFGVDLGSMGGGGAFGFDIDFGYAKDFFQSDSSVIDIMADLLVGPSVTTSSGKGVRPYANFGVGLIRPKVDDFSKNNFGWNAGGGLMVYVTSRVGIRGDVKYFHTVNNDSATDTLLLTPGSFHFWRASVGVVFQ